MPLTMKLNLITPTKTVLQDEVEEVTLNTEDGEITVLPKHSALVSILRPGQLVAKKDGKSMPLATAGGVVEMRANQLTILADTAEPAEEIDVERAEERAKELARKLADETKLDITTYKTLQRQFEKEQARIGVAKKWRK